MNQKTPIGPVIGSGIVFIILLFGAVSLGSKVFKERTRPTILPVITEYENIGTSTITVESEKTATTTELQDL